MQGPVRPVEIAGQPFHLHPKENAEVLKLGLVVLQRLHVFQIPDVLAQQGIGSLAQGEPRLLLGATGQQAVDGDGHLQGMGHIAPAAAQGVLFSSEDSYQGVVTPGDNVPVVASAMPCKPSTASRFLMNTGQSEGLALVITRAEKPSMSR